MGPALPVICKNPQCCAVTFPEQGVHVMPGGFAHIPANSVSIGIPCPSCGEVANIPPGHYTHTTATLFRQDDFAAIFKAIQSINEQIKAGATSEEIHKEVAKNPVLSFLSRYIPKDIKELAILFSMLAAAYYACRGDEHPVEVPVNQDVQRILKAIVEQHEGQRDSRTQSPDSDSQQAVESGQNSSQTSSGSLDPDSDATPFEEIGKLPRPPELVTSVIVHLETEREAKKYACTRCELRKYSSDKLRYGSGTYCLHFEGADVDLFLAGDAAPACEVILPCQYVVDITPGPMLEVEADGPVGKIVSFAPSQSMPNAIPVDSIRRKLQLLAVPKGRISN